MVRSAATYALCTAALLGTGCVSDGPPERQRPTLPPPPETPNIQRMWLLAQMPSDSNGNGYPDTVDVAVRLFEGDAGYPLPLVAKGTFKYELKSKGKTLYSREFSSPGTAPPPLRDQAGIFYAFKLSLLDEGGTDVVDADIIELHATFTTPEGRLVKPGNVVMLSFGRIH